MFLTKANQNLSRIFGAKHVPITPEEIELVYSRQLLGIINAKTTKGISLGYLTGILYLAPNDLSGVNLCPSASTGCKASCLFTAGRGRFYKTTRQRMIKTLAYLSDKPRFVKGLHRSIKSLIVKARNKGLKPVVSLNGTSDILF